MSMNEQDTLHHEILQALLQHLKDQETFDDPFVDAVHDGRSERLFRRLLEVDTRLIVQLFDELVRQDPGVTVERSHLEGVANGDTEHVDLAMDLYLTLLRVRKVFQRFFGERLDDNPLLLNQEYTVFDLYLHGEGMPSLFCWILYYVLTVSYGLRVYAPVLEESTSLTTSKQLQRVDLSRNVILCPASVTTTDAVIKRAILQGSGIATLHVTLEERNEEHPPFGVPITRFLLLPGLILDPREDQDVGQWAKR
jgi:hypothetical protein